MNSTPCFQCKERQAGCHSDCDKYKHWKAAYDAEKQRIQDIKSADYGIIECKRRVKIFKEKGR